jgi:hypothetical protein
MNPTALNHFSENEIVKLYANLCIDQSIAMDREEQKRVNYLFWQIHALENELKSRLGDRRHVLKKLYTHPNIQVRLTAARATLAADYASARHEIEAVARSKIYPQAGDAGMTIENLDSGFYKPT